MNTIRKLMTASVLAVCALTHLSSNAGIVLLENDVAISAITDIGTGTIRNYTDLTDIEFFVEDLSATGSRANNNTILSYLSSGPSNFATTSVFEHAYFNKFDESPADEVSSRTKLKFSIDEDTAYSVNGFYSLLDPGYASLFASNIMIRNDEGDIIFQDYSVSRETDNELFDIGLIGDADYTNTNIGSMAGILSAGTYEFLSVNYMRSVDGFGNTAFINNAASGCAGLLLGEGSLSRNCDVSFADAEPTDVPEPGSILLMSLGGLLLLGRRALNMA